MPFVLKAGRLVSDPLGSIRQSIGEQLGRIAGLPRAFLESAAEHGQQVRAAAVHGITGRAEKRPPVLRELDVALGTIVQMGFTALGVPYDTLEYAVSGGVQGRGFTKAYQELLLPAGVRPEVAESTSGILGLASSIALGLVVPDPISLATRFRTASEAARVSSTRSFQNALREAQRIARQVAGEPTSVQVAAVGSRVLANVGERNPATWNNVQNVIASTISARQAVASENMARRVFRLTPEMRGALSAGRSEVASVIRKRGALERLVKEVATETPSGIARYVSQSWDGLQRLPEITRRAVMDAAISDLEGELFKLVQYRGGKVILDRGIVTASRNAMAKLVERHGAWVVPISNWLQDAAMARLGIRARAIGMAMEKAEKAGVEATDQLMRSIAAVVEKEIQRNPVFRSFEESATLYRNITQAVAKADPDMFYWYERNGRALVDAVRTVYPDATLEELADSISLAAALSMRMPVYREAEAFYTLIRGAAEQGIRISDKPRFAQYLSEHLGKGKTVGYPEPLAAAVRTAVELGVPADIKTMAFATSLAHAASPELAQVMYNRLETLKNATSIVTATGRKVNIRPIARWMAGHLQEAMQNGFRTGGVVLDVHATAAANVLQDQVGAFYQWASEPFLRVARELDVPVYRVQSSVWGARRLLSESLIPFLSGNRRTMAMVGKMAADMHDTIWQGALRAAIAVSPESWPLKIREAAADIASSVSRAVLSRLLEAIPPESLMGRAVARIFRPYAWADGVDGVGTASHIELGVLAHHGMDPQKAEAAAKAYAAAAGAGQVLLKRPVDVKNGLSIVLRGERDLGKEAQLFARLREAIGSKSAYVVSLEPNGYEVVILKGATQDVLNDASRVFREVLGDSLLHLETIGQEIKLLRLPPVTSAARATDVATAFLREAGIEPPPNFAEAVQRVWQEMPRIAEEAATGPKATMLRLYWSDEATNLSREVTEELARVTGTTPPPQDMVEAIRKMVSGEGGYWILGGGKEYSEKVGRMMDELYQFLARMNPEARTFENFNRALLDRVSPDRVDFVPNLWSQLDDATKKAIFHRVSNRLAASDDAYEAIGDTVFYPRPPRRPLNTDDIIEELNEADARAVEVAHEIMKNVEGMTRRGAQTIKEIFREAELFTHPKAETLEHFPGVVAARPYAAAAKKVMDEYNQAIAIARTEGISNPQEAFEKFAAHVNRASFGMALMFGKASEAGRVLAVHRWTKKKAIAETISQLIKAVQEPTGILKEIPEDQRMVWLAQSVKQMFDPQAAVEAWEKTLAGAFEAIRAGKIQDYADLVKYLGITDKVKHYGRTMALFAQANAMARVSTAISNSTSNALRLAFEAVDLSLRGTFAKIAELAMGKTPETHWTDAFVFLKSLTYTLGFTLPDTLREIASVIRRLEAPTTERMLAESGIQAGGILQRYANLIFYLTNGIADKYFGNAAKFAWLHVGANRVARAEANLWRQIDRAVQRSRSVDDAVNILESVFRDVYKSSRGWLREYASVANDYLLKIKQAETKPEAVEELLRGLEQIIPRTALTDHWTRVSELVAKRPKALAQEAAEMGRRMTFNHTPEGMLANFVNALMKTRSEHPWLVLLTPFVRTPYNITMWYAKEFLPTQMAWAIGGPWIGVPLAAGQVIKGLYQRNPDAVAHALARAVIGAGTTGYAIWLNDMGVLRGPGPIDPNRRAMWISEGPANSIKVGDRWVSIAAFQPFSWFFLIPAGINETKREGEAAGYPAWSYVTRGTVQIIRNVILEAPFLQWMANFFDLLTPSGISGLPLAQRATRYIADLMLLMVPGIMQQMQRALIPYFPERRVQTTELDPLLIFGEGIRRSLAVSLPTEPLRRIGVSIPGLEPPPPRLDPLGRPQENLDHWAIRMLWATAVVRDDPIVKELSRLGVSIGRPAPTVQYKQEGEWVTYRRPEQLVRDIQQIRGYFYRIALGELMEDPDYWLLPDDKKRDIIRMVIERIQRQTSEGVRRIQNEYMELGHSPTAAAAVREIMDEWRREGVVSR
jgi:hypothetical protein